MNKNKLMILRIAVVTLMIGLMVVVPSKIIAMETNEGGGGGVISHPADPTPDPP